MSYDATTWAFRQRGIKPAAKLVLLYLADCHNPSKGGTFPSQEWLAEQCAVPRSTLNGYLDQLEEAGLIARERRKKAGSTKQDRTRYYFPFEPAFAFHAAAKSSPKAGHGSSVSESENRGFPSPENGDCRVQNLDSNHVREPVIESVKERDARATSRDRLRADLVKRVQRFCSGQGYQRGEWKGWTGSTIDHIAREFAALTAEQQDAACANRDPFLEKCARDGVAKPMPAANYFRDLAWEVMAVPPADVPAAGKIDAPMFGPAWSAARIIALLAGSVDVMLPGNIRDVVAATFEAKGRISHLAAMRYAHGKALIVTSDGGLIFPDDFEVRERERRVILEGFPEVNRLHDAWKKGMPVQVDARYGLLKDVCEAVPIGSQMWEKWRQWHDLRGFPWLPDTGAMRVVWFPAGGPAGILAFEMHVEGVFDGKS